MSGLNELIHRTVVDTMVFPKIVIRLLSQPTRLPLLNRGQWAAVAVVRVMGVQWAAVGVVGGAVGSDRSGHRRWGAVGGGGMEKRRKKREEKKREGNMANFLFHSGSD